MTSPTTAATPTTAPAPISVICHCRRCGVAYDWRRNVSSTLKMTYCNSLCEASDLGFTIEALIHAPAPAA